MIRLAVIGAIGSGKSYIAKKFGFPVFNADSEVVKLYKKNKKCYLNLKKALPNYITSFPVKKTELLKAILDHKDNLKKIEKIVHPEVRKQMFIFNKKNRNKKLVVLDIPLLLENKLNKRNDILVFVDAKKKEINKRLKKRKNKNFKILKKFQLPVELKKKKADFVIKNNFKNKSLEKNVKKIIKKVLLNA